MSKIEREKRAIREAGVQHRRDMVKGVDEFYNSVPEGELNPHHKEDFETLLGLMVNDRSEKPDKKPEIFTRHNLISVGFTERGSEWGTIYVRGEVKILPAEPYKVRTAEFGQYQIEKFRQTLTALEIEIARMLKKEKK